LEERKNTEDSDSEKWFIISWEIGWLIIGNL
jgi:hypothetical protein